MSEKTEPADSVLMHSAIQRVATGPELSKNLSYEETQSVMHAILNGSADPVQSAVFFIGLRMKRETDDEFKGVLDALRHHTIKTTAELPDVLVMAEPYNGFNRTIQGSLFSLPVMAALGLPAYSHGVELVGPKFGVTHHTILKALGANPLLSVEQATARLADASIGWAYIDQRQFAPELEALTALRNKIIKRPVLSTTEVLLCPIKGKSRTHLMTGYVHKPYREVYAMLARHASFDSLLLVRGTEGGVIPSFRADAHVVRYGESFEYEEHDLPIEPLGMLRDYRALDIPETMPKPKFKEEQIGMKWNIDSLADMCANEGRQALEGKQGPVHDAAVMGAALALWHTGMENNLSGAVDKARNAIKSGEALARLDAAIAAG